jgi:hypothetical protein
MELFIESAAAFGIIIFWMLSVVLVIRIFGIRVWPIRGKRDALRDRGKVVYVLIRGVVLWGWGVLLAISTSNYVAVRFFHESSRELSLIHLIIKFIVFSVAGIWFGLIMWDNSRPNISNESASPHSV